MELLLRALDVSITIFPHQKIGHILVNVGPRGWNQDYQILLPLNRDPYILRIGALAPSITCQGLGGSGELIGLGYGPHIVDVALQVLS